VKETKTKNFRWYKENYPVQTNDGKAILYKAVHKIYGKYFSDYDRSFTYEIGKEYKIKAAPKNEGACAPGLHVSHSCGLITSAVLGKIWQFLNAKF
jgi:hypothetical protein